MPSLSIRNARVFTPKTPAKPGQPLRAPNNDELTDLGLCDLLIDDGLISSIKPLKPNTKPRKPRANIPELDAKGRALLPGLIDCHTHACFAGSRLSEWDDKRRGVPYLDILKRGGGIMSTVRAVRDASQTTLTDLLLERLHTMLRCGSTTIEVKSGYGLSTDAELKMLRAIRDAADRFPGTVVPTALLAHAIDETQPGFVGRTTRETLPAVATEFPGITVDAFCEKGAWSLEQCALYYERARALNLPARVHADQFNSLGMTPAAVRLGFKSVDHLEASTPEDLTLLAQSPTIGVMLPICGLHLDNRYARGRKFLQAGGALCIASNFNPGSAPSPSLCEAIATSTRHLGLSPAEAIVASTHNPACLLGFKDRGRVEEGLRADLIILTDEDPRALAFQLGLPPLAHVITNGQVVN